MTKSDSDLQLEAMCHLEHVIMRDDIPDTPEMKRLWAAHYLVQAMDGGPRPENYDQVLAEARALSPAETDE